MRLRVKECPKKLSSLNIFAKRLSQNEFIFNLGNVNKT